MPRQNPILVTGSHRSGTTWTGRMLCAGPAIGYVHEPFNVDLRFGFGPEVRNWYQHIDAANAAEFEPGIASLLDYGYPLAARLKSARSIHDLREIRHYKRQLADYRKRNLRLLIKDPLAFFATEWLANRFGFDVVVTIRHPAAFCSSLKLRNWRFDFSHLARQPRLLDSRLGDFADQVRDYAAAPRDLIDEASLLWNCIHHVADGYRHRHPDWIFVRHEDLSRDPVAGFRSLYERLGIAFPEEVAGVIESASGAHNPAEQTATDELARDSRANILNWKKRLSDVEIARIREATAAVAERFYSDEDW